METTYPVNAFTGTEYSGMNATVLETVKATRNYTSNTWASFLEWKKHGFVLKNAKGQGVRCRFVCSGTKVKKQNASGKTIVGTEGFFINNFVLFNGDLAVKAQPKNCPRCKQILGEYPEQSKRENITVCSQCYTLEALEK